MRSRNGSPRGFAICRKLLTLAGGRDDQSHVHSQLVFTTTYWSHATRPSRVGSLELVFLPEGQALKSKCPLQACKVAPLILGVGTLQRDSGVPDGTAVPIRHPAAKNSRLLFAFCKKQTPEGKHTKNFTTRLHRSIMAGPLAAHPP